MHSHDDTGGRTRKYPKTETFTGMEQHKEERKQEVMRLRFQKGDLIAVATVLLSAVLVFVLLLPGKDAKAARVEIYRDGVLIQTLPLEKDAEFTVSGEYTNVITVSGGRVAVTEADCPGEDCVRSGRISTPGRSLVCLPNRVEIRIVSDGGDFDLIAG